MKDKVDLVEVRVTHDYTAQEEEGSATFIVTSSISQQEKLVIELIFCGGGEGQATIARYSRCTMDG